MSKSFEVKAFYYIAPFENVTSILRQGIMSNDRMSELGIEHKSIGNESIIEARRQRRVTGRRTLTSYVNMYLWPRNSMLYKVIDAGRGPVDDTAVLQVKKSALSIPGAVLSAGNAASNRSRLYRASDVEAVLKAAGDSLGKEFWTDVVDGERKAMAELLVPDVVPESFIDTIFVSSEDAKGRLQAIFSGNSAQGLALRPIVVEPKMFFQRESSSQLTPTLSLIKGDMFFSQMQTLTISVNCVGVMGRGLASRTKFQYPSVYVFYEELCKRKILKLGRPFLYKPETDGSYLPDEACTNGSKERWFLLFPTKDHWRHKADIKGIEKGLEWLVKVHKREKVKSLAVPALGCGNGWLKWEEVGPLICPLLASLEIPVELYLPAEVEVPKEQLTRDFLLRRRVF